MVPKKVHPSSGSLKEVQAAAEVFWRKLCLKVAMTAKE
jgi:hypothetical protein